MRNYFITCIAIFLFAIPALAQAQDEPEEPPPPPNPEELTEAEKELHDVLDDFGRMWELRDMDMFEQLIANDPDIIIVGTDTAEYIVGYNDFKNIRQAQYDAFDNIDHNVRSRDVRFSEDGNVAWFTERFDLFAIDGNDEHVFLRDLRLSGVLEKRDEDWKIVHLHTSVPVSGQAAQY